MSRLDSGSVVAAAFDQTTWRSLFHHSHYNAMQSGWILYMVFRNLQSAESGVAAFSGQ